MVETVSNVKIPKHFRNMDRCKSCILKIAKSHPHLWDFYFVQLKKKFQRKYLLERENACNAAVLRAVWQMEKYHRHEFIMGYIWRKSVAFHASSSHPGKKAIEAVRELNCIYTYFGSEHHLLGVLSNLNEPKRNDVFCIRWLEGAML